MEGDDNAKSQMWHHLNLARLYQIIGDFQKSKEAFAKAEEILNEYEERAKISMRNVGSSAGSLLFSKGAETYYGKGYERSLMHTLNAFNYLMLGDVNGAAIEMRKMEKRQEFWLAESSKKIQEAADQKAKIANSPDDGAITQNYSMRALLSDPEIAAMVNNYQDPFSYSLSSMVAVLNNDIAYAEVSARRAAQLNPDARNVLEQSPITSTFMKQIVTDPQPTKNSAKSPAAIPPSGPDTVDVLAVLLTGRGPSLKVENIPLPIGRLNYTTLDLPALVPPDDTISAIQVSNAGQPQSVYHLLHADKLAYKTLKDELPMEIATAIIRAASKGGMAYVASENGGGDLGGLLASVVMNVASAQMELSYRNWELLPNSGYLSSFRAKRSDPISIRIDGVEYPCTAHATAPHGVVMLISALSPNTVRINHAQY